MYSSSRRAINAHAQRIWCRVLSLIETGESLPGVSVVVKGTTNGTVTDVIGKYSIQSDFKRYIVFHICRYGGTRYKSCRTENDQCGDEG
ncbi:carboxypeptidase-like regulatory domain-containing protein [Bacteroides thetaiotaomicron]|nr:carboxypeptidase-like regulatory domain-containing protein [Bacteroides thetaiotaomicron]